MHPLLSDCFFFYISLIWAPETILPLLLIFSEKSLHVLVGIGSGPARNPCLILEIIPVSILLQAEERRTAEKRRSDSDRGPESEHSRKVSGPRSLCGDPCLGRGNQ